MKVIRVTIFVDGTRPDSITGAPVWLMARAREALDAWAAGDGLRAAKRTRAANVPDLIAFLRNKFMG
jgi:hypothetical protein